MVGLEVISVLGYLDLESGRIHCDILDDHLRPVGRLRFWRDREPDYPGFLVAGRGNRLLAVRSRPFPQVGIWEFNSATEPTLWRQRLRQTLDFTNVSLHLHESFTPPPHVR
jgi:hypothetical protein